MKKIFSNIKEEIFVLLFYSTVILIILSFVVFQLEHEAQPDVFTNVFQTMWWGVATLTTVGYGDMYPITTSGKIITAIITLMGIAFIAIPGGMFASEFITEIGKKNENEKCPKCGSSSIKVYADPTLKYSGKISSFKVVSICNECQFIWLE